MTVKIKEIDGSPSGTADIIQVTNGSLTLSGNTATVDTSAGNAPSSAHYLTSTSESSLSAEVNLGALTTGVLYITVSGGTATPSTATEGTHYYKPGGTDVAVADGGTGASSASAARSNLGSAASGAVGSSDITMSSGFLLGRYSASTGAIQEITISTGLSLDVSGNLTASGGGGGGGTMIVQEMDVSVSATADTLDFREGFDLTESPSGEVNISLDLTEINYLGSRPMQGATDNFKLSVTVASNNLTVAVKGLDGNDPSSTNIVYVRIGDTVRSITGALSVTKNAGTNWCNAGGAELATLEADYFVYLGYNATDGVVIGFSRIPYANKYGDFSTTSTAETYAGISTITTAASTDYYELVGRFAATLSAGAGYTWTVPTFTASNLINRPIYETRWLTWTPTLTVSGGTAPTYTNQFVNRYQISGRILRLGMKWSNSAGGTAGNGANAIVGTLPMACNSSMYTQNRPNFAYGATANGATGKFIMAQPDTTNSTFNIYDNGTVNISGNGQNNATRVIILHGDYEL